MWVRVSAPCGCQWFSCGMSQNVSRSPKEPAGDYTVVALRKKGGNGFMPLGTSQRREAVSHRLGIIVLQNQTQKMP